MGVVQRGDNVYWAITPFAKNVLPNLLSVSCLSAFTAADATPPIRPPPRQIAICAIVFLTSSKDGARVARGKINSALTAQQVRLD